jgi:drug/metabolite transporter (DMT)-like permease
MSGASGAAGGPLGPARVTELLALAALWGASFLFMRLGASDFGPVALAFLRVAIAALTLLPILLWRNLWRGLLAHWRPIAVVGVVNSALPFLAYSYAALSITAGLSAVFNATSPLWAAVVAWWWLGERPSRLRMTGLAVGFVGVVGLALVNANQPAAFKPGGSGWAVVACTGATLLYGLAACATRRWLAAAPPLAVAAGSQMSATVFLALPALWLWPAENPGAASWGSALLLGALCTGIAYILYFRLIASIGPSRAISVTFLIPAFAVVWGWTVLGETVTVAMVVGCGVILLGTALASGLLRLPSRS